MVTLVGIGLGAFLLHDMRAEFAWWFSAPATVELGGAQGYRLDQAADGALAKIEGRAGGSAARFRKLGKRYEIVAIEGTNILVQREMTGPDLPLSPGQKEPPPDRAPFSAEGRLLMDTSAPIDYGQAFQLLVERGDALPRDGHLFVLLDGDKPRSGLKTPLALLAIASLVALNLWTLGRALLPRR